MKNYDRYEKMWDFLLLIWPYNGTSALTTFYFARYEHGFPLIDAYRLMKMQIKELGVMHPGGNDVVRYRGVENIKAILTTQNTRK